MRFAVTLKRIHFYSFLFGVLAGVLTSGMVLSPYLDLAGTALNVSLLDILLNHHVQFVVLLGAILILKRELGQFAPRIFKGPGEGYTQESPQGEQARSPRSE